MGKMKKLKISKQARSISLGQQIANVDEVKNSGRIKIRNRYDDDDNIIDDRLSKKILESAREQQDELEEELGVSGQSVRPKVPTFTREKQDSSDSESEADLNPDDDNYQYEDIDEEDEKALAFFMNPNPPTRRTLADIIMEKITEKQTEINTQFTDTQSVQMNDLDEKVVEVFKGVGKVLSIYRSGKLPKAFKIIPSLVNWEQILFLTNPDRWSAASMYSATRIFSSNLKENAAQRFYNLVLLPRIRDDIAEYKRLNVHLYQALFKSLFKPGAFYKGFLLPLCESGTCNLREAVIISSVIGKNSIPALHSAAAVLKIAEMDYNGANSIFIQTILNKKYALPYRVIDGLVHHFLKFQHDKRKLPVLWHQALLAFIQNYKDDISVDQKDALADVLKVHIHHQITAEIRRELQNSKNRGDNAMQISDQQ